MLGITDQEYLFLTTSGDFPSAVRDNLDHWKLTIPEIVAAVKVRAITPGDQQTRFIAIYLAIIGHPAAEAVEALVEDGPAKRPSK